MRRSRGRSSFFAGGRGSARSKPTKTSVNCQQAARSLSLSKIMSTVLLHFDFARLHKVRCILNASRRQNDVVSSIRLGRQSQLRVGESVASVFVFIRLIKGSMRI